MATTKTKAPKMISITISGGTLVAVRAIAKSAGTDTNTVVNVIVAIELRRLRHAKK